MGGTDDSAIEQVDEEALAHVHPNHEKLVRAQLLILAVPIVIGAIIAMIAGGTIGLIAGPLAILLAAFFAWYMPHRRFLARGFAMGTDRLRVVRGLLFRSDTVVPFGRVQHIDVDRGPLERYYGLATLTLHTAGTHNASVALPGLLHEDALAMREEIRAHIKRETL
ncbi:PH domain-containing protein [Erythrobacter sp. LQ02-29]|uniref:PH domain-containing protein n=1 Tax=Erythrobacter sp. LQ02-29 TaxID=2920384 RepID=UPI001F4E4423|nr:PH domain-containing protein [Erythrobacter sp. LQ02-29]MCP9221760.1 PH domain-containing protein [Erythrobacter sp. LQ02-29]